MRKLDKIEKAKTWIQDVFKSQRISEVEIQNKNNQYDRK